MLKRVARRVAQNPWVYDHIQFLAGARLVRQRLAEQIAALGAVNVVLDVGGGTGLYRQVLPSDSRYICLDLDMIKLLGLRSKHVDAFAVCGDAARLPLRSRSVDMIMCIAVLHHLSDQSVVHFLGESNRVLTSEGIFLFVDPIWKPNSLVGRLLWKFDVGSNPRTAGSLYSVISTQFQIVYQAQFTIYHTYILCIGRKTSAQRHWE